MIDTTTLHVRIASTDEFYEAVLENFSSPIIVELLRAVVNGASESMPETARFVDRDIKEVARNLHELHELWLVKFEQEGCSKCPIIAFDRIEIDGPILSEAGGRAKPADV